MKISVLVVDDSAFMRKSISLLIVKDPLFEVVGIARTGLEAIEKVKLLKPNVVTLDITMPEMDGLTALKQIMRDCPTPVVMVSSLTDFGASATIEALEHGAVDCILKTNLMKDPLDEPVYNHFMTVLKSAANAKVKRSAMPSSPSSIPVIMPTFNRHLATELICIGSSTGGPAALQAILPRFPKETNVPILVAQHMPPGFTKPFAERFNNLCQMPVKEAEDGEVLKVGVIYICPSGFQTTVQRTSEGVVLKVESNAKYKALYEPSVDVVISSLVPVFGPKLLTVILTGMGNDGMEGCKLAKKAGGHVVVESEDSCVVYGMPRSVYESGASHAKLHLGEIFNYISHFIEKR